MCLDRLQRREFITLIGGAAAAWPIAAQAQQPERMRRIGVLIPTTADDAGYQARMGAFHQGLALLGWTIGRNVRIDIRWGAGDAERSRKYAAELAALAPDVILASGDSTVGALLQATRTVPIVFATTADPVAAGFVDSLARPGRNITGFTNFEYGMSGKWLELLKEIAPDVTRVAVLRDSAQPSGTGQFGAIQAVAPSLRVEVSPVNVRDAGEIERAVAAFARASNGGLILTGNGLANVHRELIIMLRPGTNCLRSTSNAPSSPPAAWFPTGPISSTSSGKRPVMSIASSGASNRPTCQCRRQPSSNSSSTSRPLRRSASKYHRHCSPAPTR